MTAPSPFLPNTNYFPLEGASLQRELNNSYIDIANAVNQKDIGIYSTQATSTGQKFFPITASNPSRATLRRAYTATSILNGTTSIAHGITLTATTFFTRIYGTANQALTQFLPLPYINTGTPGDSIQLRVTATNIEIITTTANWTAFNAMVILEYIPN